MKFVDKPLNEMVQEHMLRCEVAHVILPLQPLNKRSLRDVLLQATGCVSLEDELYDNDACEDNYSLRLIRQSADMVINVETRKRWFFFKQLYVEVLQFRREGFAVTEFDPDTATVVLRSVE